MSKCIASILGSTTIDTIYVMKSLDQKGVNFTPPPPQMTRKVTCFMQMTFEWLPPALSALFTASSPSIPTPPSLVGPPQARFLLISFICLTDCHMWTCFSLVRKALISSCLFSSPSYSFFSSSSVTLILSSLYFTLLPCLLFFYSLML